jgi:hypothetical protein
MSIILLLGYRKKKLKIKFTFIRMFYCFQSAVLTFFQFSRVLLLVNDLAKCLLERCILQACYLVSCNARKYVCIIFEYGTALLDDWCPTFRDNRVVSS